MNVLNTVLSLSLIAMMANSESTIVDFRHGVNANNWRIVDDGVMGGRSNGAIAIDRDQGVAVYSGKVSLDNNGGFSSVRTQIQPVDINNRKTIVLKIKGDGKNYQFRLRHNIQDYHSYVYEFSTSGEWEEIKIPLNEMTPRFRGRTLDQDNFNYASFEEVAFLIGNKKAENFELQIAYISIK